MNYISIIFLLKGSTPKVKRQSDLPNENCIVILQ